MAEQGRLGRTLQTLTALSLQEKSFFFPGAHPTGLPAASVNNLEKISKHVFLTTNVGSH